jgi:hypothetical protein
MSKNLFALTLILFSLAARADQADQNDPCAPDASGNISNQTYITTGEEDNFDWGSAVACVARPIRETWAVLHNQTLMVWGGVNTSEYTAAAQVPAGYTHLYQVGYHVKSIIGTISWYMNWLHQVTAGTMQDPSEIKVTYEKVNGTSYISYWKGTIFLNASGPKATQVVIRNEIKASQQNAEKAGQTAGEMVQKLRTGEPNWAPIK